MGEDDQAGAVEETQILVEDQPVEPPAPDETGGEDVPDEATDESEQEESWDSENPPDLLTALSNLGEKLEAQIDRRFNQLEQRGKGRRKRPQAEASASPAPATETATDNPPADPPPADDPPAQPVEDAPPSPSRKRRLTW